MGLLDRGLLFADGRLFAPIKGGRLSAGRTEADHAHQMAAIRLWPDPGAWIGRTDWAEWVPWRPEIGFVDLERAARFGPEGTRQACERVLGTLPNEIGLVLSAFPEHAISLLRLVWNEPRALDLVRSAPALAFALAVGDLIAGRAFADTRILAPGLSVKKRVEIAGWLGLPATRGSVRVLERVAPGALRVRDLERLRQALLNADADTLKLLGHAPRVNSEVIELVRRADLRALYSPSFLAEASQIVSEGRYLSSRLRAVARDWHVTHPGRPVPRFESIQQLQEAHEAAKASLELRKRLAGPAFPAPPVEGTDLIQPIRTLDELIDEGIVQRHCVATYAHDIRSGRVFIYRVLGPERCTLSVVGERGHYRVDQLYLACNRPPGMLAVSAVAEWLKRANEADQALRAPALAEALQAAREAIANQQQYPRLSGARIENPKVPWWKAIFRRGADR